MTEKLRFSILLAVLIGLISDTHIATSRETLPVQVKSAFSDVDLILHAGDIWIPSVLDELESIAPVMAVWGDDDMEMDFGHDSRMMKRHTLSFEGVALWLTHVKPPYSRINPEETSYNVRLDDQGHENPPDVIIYGHTHSTAIELYKDVLLVNPGSATMPNYVPKLGTVGLLTIDGGKVVARIVPLK